MNKKGRNFEVIWVSRDRTADEFAEYFYKMPWLAIPVDNLNTIAEQLGAKYQMRGKDLFYFPEAYAFSHQFTC